jgi:hypothetical protein
MSLLTSRADRDNGRLPRLLEVQSDGTFKIKDEAQKAMAPDAIGKTHDAAITHVGPKCDFRKCPTEKTGRKAGLHGPNRRMPLAQSRLGVDFLAFCRQLGELRESTKTADSVAVLAVCSELLFPNGQNRESSLERDNRESDQVCIEPGKHPLVAPKYRPGQALPGSPEPPGRGQRTGITDRECSTEKRAEIPKVDLSPMEVDERIAHITRLPARCPRGCGACHTRNRWQAQ